jgi:hypothetical protein
MRTIFNFLFINFWTGLLFLILHCLICDLAQNVGMAAFSFFAILTYAFYQVKKIELVRKLAFYLYNPWWKNLIIIVLLVSAGLYFNNLTCFVLAFPLSVVSLFYQFIRNKLWIGIVNAILMFAVSLLSLFAMTFESINPSPKRVQSYYASSYEDLGDIEDIIGLELPEFEIISSKVDESKGREYEFTKTCEIEFEEQIEPDFFLLLDSLCNLNTPDKLNPNSKTFYQGVEGKFHCWNKDSNTYIFNKDYMFTDEKDQFFKLKITKGSKKAELSYGTF